MLALCSVGEHAPPSAVKSNFQNLAGWIQIDRHLIFDMVIVVLTSSDLNVQRPAPD